MGLFDGLKDIFKKQDETEAGDDVFVADSFSFGVEREMKESGEKGGTEDINIGVGELQETTISKSMDADAPGGNADPVPSVSEIVATKPTDFPAPGANTDEPAPDLADDSGDRDGTLSYAKEEIHIESFSWGSTQYDGGRAEGDLAADSPDEQSSGPAGGSGGISFTGLEAPAAGQASEGQTGDTMTHEVGHWMGDEEDRTPSNDLAAGEETAGRMESANNLKQMGIGMHGSADQAPSDLATGDGPEPEAISLNYSKIEFEYKPQKPDGPLDNEEGGAPSDLAEQGDASADVVPTDQVSFNYSKIEFEYKPQKPDGSLDNEEEPASSDLAGDDEPHTDTSSPGLGRLVSTDGGRTWQTAPDGSPENVQSPTEPEAGFGDGSVRFVRDNIDSGTWARSAEAPSDLAAGGDASPDVVPTDQVSFNYSKIEFEYKPEAGEPPPVKNEEGGAPTDLAEQGDASADVVPTDQVSFNYSKIEWESAGGDGDTDGRDFLTWQRSGGSQDASQQWHEDFVVKGANTGDPEPSTETAGPENEDAALPGGRAGHGDITLKRGVIDDDGGDEPSVLTPLAESQPGEMAQLSTPTVDPDGPGIEDGVEHDDTWEEQT